MHILIRLLISSLLFLLAILIALFAPLIFGAPFQPSSKKQLNKMIKLAKIKKGDKVADLGSGDGRVVIELAKHGAEAHGYEINPLLVLWSCRKIKKLGLKNAHIHWKNFWKINFRQFNKIILFQVYYIMKKLEKKIKKEALPGTKIVSNQWKFPTLSLIKKQGKIQLYKR